MKTRFNSPFVDNSWSGFVDLFSNLVVLLLFVVFVFILSQFFLTMQTSKDAGKMTELVARVTQMERQITAANNEKESLYRQINKFNNELIRASEELDIKDDRIEGLKKSYQILHKKALQEREHNKTLQNNINKMNVFVGELEGKIIKSDKIIGYQKNTNKELRQNIAELNVEMKKLNAALDAADQTIKQNEVQIVELGKRLNRALANKTAELHFYRSEFFQELTIALKDNKNLGIKGDRFVIQSEVLFASGSATIGETGQKELDNVAKILRGIAKKIPSKTKWIIRVDGHTDAAPIKSAKFKSNWELSTARAIAVVEYLISKGINPKNLAATGFGEHQPVTPGKTAEERSYNRRIEFQLTQP